MARKTYTEEDINKRIAALPEAAADFLYSAEMGGIVKQIADKHHLHIDQMSLLEAEAGELILGLTETQEFVPNLMDSLQTDKETAEAVARDINEQLISKIRAGMGHPTSTPTPSVVMPSTPKPAVPEPKPMPASTPMAAPTPPTLPTLAPKPTIAPDLMAADTMLAEKKTTSVETPKPQNYKADPYREPVE